MTTAPTAPEHGVLVGAVGASRAERTAEVVEQLAVRLGLPAGSLRLDRACPTCGSRGHGAPSLAWTQDAPDHDNVTRLTGRLAGMWGRLRGSRRAALPALPAVSLSHTAGEHPVTVLAWCAAREDGVTWTVGVDVEDIRSPRTRRALQPGEDGRSAADAVAFSAADLADWAGRRCEEAYTARVDAWCRAEALVKARGTGFTADPSAVRPAPHERVVLLAPAVESGLPDTVRGVLVLAPRTR